MSGRSPDYDWNVPPPAKPVLHGLGAKRLVIIIHVTVQKYNGSREIESSWTYVHAVESVVVSVTSDDTFSRMSTTRSTTRLGYQWLSVSHHVQWSSEWCLVIAYRRRLQQEVQLLLSQPIVLHRMH